MTNVTFLVRDRFNLTRQTLDSFGDSGNREKMSVTVLDDRSVTPTREFVECWCIDHHAAYIRNDIPTGTGVLRNTVIEASGRRGQYLYLSDNDVCFTPNWLDTLIRCYEDVWSRGFRLVGGCNHPFHQPLADRQFITNDPLHIVNRVQALALQSQLMHWEVWDAFKPFCETPVDRVCQSEDVAFANKLTEAGFKLGVVSPALIVNTGITNSFGEKIPGWEAVLQQAPPGVIVE
jgi:hypothetical protein